MSLCGGMKSGVLLVVGAVELVVSLADLVE
jgi:hypothetical protein